MKGYDLDMERKTADFQNQLAKSSGWKSYFQQSSAMTSTGGIDLTSDKALQVKNDGQAIKFHIDQGMLTQLQNAPGFEAHIMDIQPMRNLRVFLDGATAP